MCIYSTTDDAKKSPSDIIPDRPGYTCLDTIYMYTKQKRVAAILPKNYSLEKGKQAANYAETFAGCLVSPDDLYSSAFDRYAAIKIKILWWSKTWKYKIYSARSNIENEVSR